jgi:hypothetical protein
VPTKIAFSRNGTEVAYVWEDRLEELAVDGKIWCRTILLHWLRVDDPGRKSSATIEFLGIEFAGYPSVPVDVQWSPGGSWIGVLTPYRLVMVEAKSGKKRELRDGTITSFAWLSDGEVAYCACRKKGRMQRRVICRQEVAARQPRVAAEFREYEMDEYTRKEYWAPSGQYVVFVEPPVRGRYQVVDVLKQTIRGFGQDNAIDSGVAWSPDSRRAFCVSDKVGPGDGFEAVLLEPGTEKTVDCTSGFRDGFAGDWPPGCLGLEPTWTADGKYVLANCVGTGGNLIQPEPWKVVRLGQVLRVKFASSMRLGTRPSVLWLPTPGWVGVLATGNEGDSPVKYATDYLGSRLVPLLETGYLWAISPDGTVAATVGRDNRVRILSLGKWWAPAMGPTGTSSDVPPGPATR